MPSSYKQTKKSIEKRRSELDKLKNRPCTRCEKEFPPYVMDWHHIDPKTKKFGIGAGSFRYSMKKLLLEIDKCELYCSNCHRIIEYEGGSKHRIGT